MYDGPEPTRWDRTLEFLGQLFMAILHPIATYRALRDHDTE